MYIFSAFKIAIKAILSNKVRTGLTTLGMVIGIASVIIVFSAGAGVESLIFGQIEAFGSDIIETELKVPSNKKGASADSESGAALVQGVQITTLTLEDMEDIDQLPNIIQSYAGILGQEVASYQNETHKLYLFGTTEDYIDIDQSEIDYGRFWSDNEDKDLSLVAVLGSKAKEKFFGDNDPLGKSIKIRKTKFTVIGVMEERGGAFGMNFDDYIYVPVRTLQKRLMGIDHVLYMVHKVKDMSFADDTAEEIRGILRVNHDITDPAKDDFRVVTMEEMMDMMAIITSALTILLLAIVAISLVVGGVGIMNIMYVVVSERTSEIGLRKAVGANYSAIMWQFLIESVVITLVGGIIGTIFGLAISFLLYLGAKQFGLDWNFSVPLKAFVTAIGFSAFFGIAFGLYPARKAAKLNPIDALRSE